MTVWCCCLLTCSFAQVQMNRDSLLRLLPLAGKDIAAVELFINLGQQFEITEPNAYQNLKQFEQAIKYYAVGKQILAIKGNKET